jgi:DNA repair exonuclease SbcCD nuclease subunit
MYFITGDTHGDFNRIFEFCEHCPHLSHKDVMIILGDAGINYFGDERDMQRKEWLSNLPLTLFCIHGNHEMRPSTIQTYKKKLWNKGIVYVEENFPNLLFPKDGEIFNLDGKDTIVIGGAYSVDKGYRLAWGYRWFEDEQPSNDIKKYVENQLAKVKWNVYTVLTHTCPIRYEPTEVFISGVSQISIDKSTEQWLGQIEKKLNYSRWYCGHYHTNKVIDKMKFLFEDIMSFSSDSE